MPRVEVCIRYVDWIEERKIDFFGVASEWDLEGDCRELEARKLRIGSAENLLGEGQEPVLLPGGGAARAV
jgi:hypothetical protein